MSQKYIIHKGDIADNYMHKFEGMKETAIDTEAMGLNNRRDRLCLVQITDVDNFPHLIQFSNVNKYVAPNLSSILEDESILKIFHYARFDVAIMKYYLGIMTNNIYCTKIASRLCRTYTNSHGLRDLCNELLSVKINKYQQSSYWGREILKKEQCEYAMLDIIYLRQLRAKLDEMLERESRAEIAKGCFDFIKFRVLLDILGWESEDIFSHSIS